MRSLYNIKHPSFRLDPFAHPLLEYKRHPLLGESGAGKEVKDNPEKRLNDLVKAPPFCIMYHTKKVDPL